MRWLMLSAVRRRCRILREPTRTTTPAEATASAGVVVRDFYSINTWGNRHRHRGRDRGSHPGCVDYNYATIVCPTFGGDRSDLFTGVYSHSIPMCRRSGG